MCTIRVIGAWEGDETSSDHVTCIVVVRKALSWSTLSTVAGEGGLEKC